MSPLPLLVTGCGRSGTTWTAEVIRKAGWPCGHEMLFCHGDDDPDTFLAANAAEVSGTAAPYAERLHREPGVTIVHQVRHPLAVVRSAMHRKPARQSARNRRARWRNSVCPILDQYPKQPVSALAYWVHWNRLVEPYATCRWRIEDLWAATPGAIAGLTATLDVSGRQTAVSRVRAAVCAVGPRNAGLAGSGASWAQLGALDAALVDEAVDMMIRYGYQP